MWQFVYVLATIAMYGFNAVAYDRDTTQNEMSGLITNRLTIPAKAPVTVQGKQVNPIIVLICVSAGFGTLQFTVDYGVRVSNDFNYKTDNGKMLTTEFDDDKNRDGTLKGTSITKPQAYAGLVLLRGNELALQPYRYYDRDNEFGIARFDTSDKAALLKFLSTCYQRETHLPPGIDDQLEEVIVVMNDGDIMAMKEALAYFKLYDGTIDNTVDEQLLEGIHKYAASHHTIGSLALKVLYNDQKVPNAIRAKFSGAWGLLAEHL
jgi:hypothetical protein